MSMEKQREFSGMRPYWRWLHREKPGFFYRLGSRAVIMGVFGLNKILICGLNKVKVENKETLLRHVNNRSRPLLTVCNHHTNCDDPFIWTIFDWKFVFTRPFYFRFSMAATEICFTNTLMNWFFSLGRCVPVTRGEGVYQRGVDFCINRLNENQWVHMFPEGKVNMEKRPLRIKWGVGRMIADSNTNPIVLPIWHCGFDQILPPSKYFPPKVGQPVTILVGEPLDLGHLRENLRKSGATAREMRKTITDVIQTKLYEMEKPCVELHTERLQN